MSKTFKFNLLNQSLIPNYQIYVDISLAFSIQIYGWFLNDDHQLYKDCKRTFSNITLNELLGKLQTVQLCKVSVSRTLPCVIFDKKVPFSQK